MVEIIKESLLKQLNGGWEKAEIVWGVGILKVSMAPACPP